MEKEVTWKLIARVLSEEATPDELLCVNDYMNTDEKTKRYLDLLSALWNQPSLYNSEEALLALGKITVLLNIKIS